MSRKQEEKKWPWVKDFLDMKLRKKINKLDLTKLMSALQSTHKKSPRLGKNICKTHLIVYFCAEYEINAQ